MIKKEQGFLYDDKIIYGYTYINTDFIKANKNCNGCDFENDYYCFECEHCQMKTEYPDSKYTDDCEWIIKRG